MRWKRMGRESKKEAEKVELLRTNRWPAGCYVLVNSCSVGYLSAGSRQLHKGIGKSTRDLDVWDGDGVDKKKSQVDEAEQLSRCGGHEQDCPACGEGGRGGLEGDWRR